MKSQSFILSRHHHSSSSGSSNDSLRNHSDGSRSRGSSSRRTRIVDCAGYLLKQGASHYSGYRKRYFELVDNKLFYFEVLLLWCFDVKFLIFLNFF
jgi:hypothetical protein